MAWYFGVVVVVVPTAVLPTTTKYTHRSIHRRHCRPRIITMVVVVAAAAAAAVPKIFSIVNRIS